MADLSESDYGMLDYGRGYYSYWPVWLFNSAVTIMFTARAKLVSYAFRRFTASVTIRLDTKARLGIDRVLHSTTRVPIYIDSGEYIGPFWINWIEEHPPMEDWIPDIPDSGGWVQHTKTYGPWVPIGPDMRPNDG